MQTSKLYHAFYDLQNSNSVTSLCQQAFWHYLFDPKVSLIILVWLGLAEPFNQKLRQNGAITDKKRLPYEEQTL